jgi:serine/threonine-protein kinase BUR1
MAPSGGKRQASRSPGGERAVKRIATSSPEEGELDDGSAVPPVSSLPSSLPPKPVTISKSKVPFPFKRRDTARNGSSSAMVEPKESTVALYDRISEDERRIRDGGRGRKGGRGSKPHGPDHWEPGYSRGEGMSSRSHPSRRDYPSRDRRDRDRDRGRSLSPYSNTSRSPASPPSSHHREKHRLPAPRSPEATFSPPRRDYGVDRIRDRDRDHNGTWDRDRDWDSRRYRDDDSERYYLDRPLSDATDRHYRPSNTHRRGADDREWTRREEGDRRPGRRDDRAQDYDRNYDHSRRFDSYRPSSPGPSTRSGAVTPSLPPPPTPPPRRKGSSRPQPNKPDRTPPPPSFPPPPPPPPDTRLLKDQTLPTQHALVSIQMKRPAAPMDIHSPPSMPLPKVQEPEKKEEPKEPEPPRPRPVRRREPVKRTRKEEVEAYGRAFEGCGVQMDYEVTTKLGEGTFG